MLIKKETEKEKLVEERDFLRLLMDEKTVERLLERLFCVESSIIYKKKTYIRQKFHKDRMKFES